MLSLNSELAGHFDQSVLSENEANLGGLNVSLEEGALAFDERRDPESVGAIVKVTLYRIAHLYFQLFKRLLFQKL